MNGAFDKLKRATRSAHPNAIRDLLGGFALPAMAGVGTIAVVAVLAGLQCGGLDRCFVAQAQVAAAIEPAAAAEAPVAEERLVADQVVAASPVAATASPTAAPDGRARQMAALIGGSFDAIRADDAGWLSGAYSPAVPPAVTEEQGDGSGPMLTAAVEARPASAKAAPNRNADPAAGAEAVAAIAALEQPVKPLDRPQPLEVSAFAEEPKATAPAVKAAAEKQLAAVEAKAEAKVEAKQEAKAEPEPEPKQAAKKPAKKVASVEGGSSGTIAGAGVNVRSGPGKSNQTLFALAGGEKVKIGENSRGWLKVTDDRGRTGWVYKTFVN